MNTNKSWNLPAHLTVEKGDRGINVTIAKRWDCNVSARIYRRCDAAKKLAAGFAMAVTTMADLMRNRLEWDEAIAKRWSQPQPVRGNMSLVPAEIVAIVNQARQCCRQESFPDRCQHLDEALRAMAHTLHVHYADRDRREIAEDLERAKGGTPINRPHPSDCL